MKRTFKVIISASAASVLAISALAQDTLNPKTDGLDSTRQRMPHARSPDRLNAAAKASDIIGMTVNNYQDEKLGSVEDLAVDLESGRVVQVILTSGGFLGIGNSLTAVPPGALHPDTAKQVLHLNADKAKLESAPKFDANKWAECCDSNHLSAVYRHYGEEPAFNFIGQGETRRDDQRNQMDQAADPRNVVTRTNDQTWDQSRSAAARRAMIPPERLGKLQRASKIIGMTVMNRQDETLGDVENILVDLPSGRLVAVVLSSGGFLGIGDELSAVPPTVLQFSADQASLQLDATKEKLSNAPHFKANQWPNFAEPSYASGIYRAYKVEPYFTTDRTTDADNTRLNVRDRDNRTLTPFDQGNSKADTDTTAQIRKGILAIKDMSLNAKNVKIITDKGRVTLRGPVKSEEEKRLIGEIANRIARSENVDNQLEVTLKATSN